MDFSLDRIKDFPSAFSFLIDTMIQSGKYVYQEEGMVSKPFWLNQSEKFSSFYERIKRKDEALDKLKLEVVRPIFQNFEVEFNGKIINNESKVQDDFVKVSTHDSSDLTLNTPQGLFFQTGKLVLPFSETYSQVVNHNKNYKIKNNPYPLLLLIGLYTTVFNAIKEQETSVTNQCFKDNIQILLDGLEGCDGIPKRKSNQPNNPMNMLQNLMQNFDFSQLSDMMGKVTGDEKASKEFSEVFGKMTESIKDGKNPLESMGDIIKDVSSRMEDEDPDVPLVKEEPQVVKETFEPQLDPLPETTTM